ncbi:hypothetical protein D3C80_2134360 [compost metagenome]
MVGGQFARDRQAQAGALRGATADEGLEQATGETLGNARPVVGDANRHDAVAGLGRDGDPALPVARGITLDGLAGVAHQVDQDAM